MTSYDDFMKRNSLYGAHPEETINNRFSQYIDKESGRKAAIMKRNPLLKKMVFDISLEFPNEPEEIEILSLCIKFSKFWIRSAEGNDKISGSYALFNIAAIPNKTLYFDFHDFIGNMENGNTVIHSEVSNIDTESFPDSILLTREVFEKGFSFSDFTIDIDDSVKAKEILKLTFIFSDESSLDATSKQLEEINEILKKNHIR